VTKQELDVGAWINVVGTVSFSSQTERDSQSGSKSGRKRSRSRSRVIAVQAILLWSAGLLKLDDYEKALALRREVDEQMRRLTEV